MFQNWQGPALLNEVIDVACTEGLVYYKRKFALSDIFVTILPRGVHIEGLVVIPSLVELTCILLSIDRWKEGTAGVKIAEITIFFLSSNYIHPQFRLPYIIHWLINGQLMTTNQSDSRNLKHD